MIWLGQLYNALKPVSQPATPGESTVADIAEQWLERHVRKNGHRTVGETERIVRDTLSRGSAIAR